MENMDNLNWEDFSPTPADPGELKKIKKSIRKRHWLTVLTSVVLVAVLIFGAVQYGIPALESRYWDPTTSTYAEHTSDLEFAMIAFSELFVPEYNVNNVTFTKKGFASYDLNVLCFNEKNRREWNCVNASLIQNELTVPYGLWDYATIGTFTLNSSKRCLHILEQLPEYVKVQANITFPEDMCMGQVYALQDWIDTYAFNKNEYYDRSDIIEWIAIRTCDDAESTYPYCGMKPFISTFAENLKGSINEFYPHFALNNLNNISGANMEAHFLSLLEYSKDQYENGTGFLPEYLEDGEDYYQSVLDYVNENGIYSYGCTITATPQMLLDMWEDGVFIDIWIQDIWIGF